jgi:hypothetical protein
MSRKLALSETDFQRQIIDLAHLRGWLTHHGRTALNRRGQWSSPMQGDTGFPDLVLARRWRLVIAEIKSDKGETSLEQREWLWELGSALGPGHAFLWIPREWPNIERILR